MNALLIRRSTSSHPALTAYIESLNSVQSRDTMKIVLTKCARLLGGSSAAAYPWHMLRPEQATTLRSALRDRYAHSTVNRSLSGVRRVLRECLDLELMTAKQHDRVLRRLVRVAGERAVAGRYIERAELRKLFSACDATPRGLRDAALLALLCGYGLRRDECAGARIECYDRESGDLRVVGKGNRERVIEGGANAHRTINAWLAARGEAPGPILCPVSARGAIEIRRVDATTIHRQVKCIAVRAHVANVASHDFRRTFASNLLDLSRDLPAVQALMGHASPVTTARYDRRGERTRRAAMATVSIPWEPPVARAETSAAKLPARKLQRAERIGRPRKHAR